MTNFAGSRRVRDPWLDNARFILIVLVIFGHLLEPLIKDHASLAAVYRFLYVFHVPALAFVSGAVAHPVVDSRAWRSITFRLLWPCLVFQSAYALAALLPVWPDAGPSGVATPYWLLWYLLSLACWRALLPLFAHLRYSMAIAVAAALLVGCFSDVGYYFSLSRTLVFFPLFLLGWFVAGRWRVLNAPMRQRSVAALVLAATLVAVAWWRPDPRWLYGSVGYAALETTVLQGMGLRLLLIALSMACTWAFLALVPRRQTRFSGAGARSLGAYVLHGFVVRLAVGVGCFAFLDRWHDGLLAAALAVAATGLAVALSSRLAARILRPAIAPVRVEQWLWRESVDSAGGIHDTART